MMMMARIVTMVVEVVMIIIVLTLKLVNFNLKSTLPVKRDPNSVATTVCWHGLITAGRAFPD